MFPKIRGYYFGGPHNTHHNFLGVSIGAPLCRETIISGYGDEAPFLGRLRREVDREPGI